MLMNNAVSAAAGFIPILGDVILAAYKANSRNAALLEEFLRIRGEEFLKRDNERVENPENVRPGAGHAAGEPVTGVPTTSTKSGGWFRKRSKGKEVQVAPALVHQPASRESRFYENVDDGTSKKRK